MFVSAGIRGQIVTGLRVRLPRRLLRLLVDLLLRQSLAAEIPKPVEPGHRLIAANSIEDMVDQNSRRRGWYMVAKDGHAQFLAGHHLHRCSPADPTAGMANDPLPAIGPGPEAEAVVGMTEFDEFRCGHVNARCLQL